MNNIFSFDLNLPCKCINDDFDFQKKITKSHCRLVNEEVVNQELIEFLKLLKIKITIVEGFRKYPKPMNYTIHKDDYDCNDRAKINYILQDNDSYMAWYKPLEPGYVSKGETGAYPERYYPDKVELIHKAKIKTPSIIQSQIPHDIINPLSVRYNIAISIRDFETDEIITFEEAFDRFKDYVI